MVTRSFDERDADEKKLANDKKMEMS